MKNKLQDIIDRLKFREEEIAAFLLGWFEGNASPENEQIVSELSEDNGIEWPYY